MKHIKTFKQVNESTYYDMNMEVLKLGDLVEVQVVTGSYGQTKKYQGKITSMPDKLGNIVLDNEYTVTNPFNKTDGKYVGYDKYVDYEHGHEKYVKLINPSDRDSKLDVPKAWQPTFTIRLIDYRNGKNKNKGYEQDFPITASVRGKSELEAWLSENYPEAELFIWGETKSFGTEWRMNYEYLSIHQSAKHASGHMLNYIIPDNN